MKISSLHRYSGLARITANRIKNATDDAALEAAAKEMAVLIPENAVLIPAPSSCGRNMAMTALAHKVAALVPGASVVAVIVRKTAVPSSATLRRANRTAVSFEDHVVSMKLVARPPMRRHLVVIDNVVSGRNTLRAMQRVIGKKIEAVVYADASRRAA